MSKVLSIGAPALRRTQQGVSLVVVLVLLVVMSILGIAVLRSSAMQERMSANMVDRNEAMQAAETGLIEAQDTVIRGTFNAMWNGSSDFTTLRGAKTCAANGLCDRSDPNVPAKWETAPTEPTNWVHVVPGDTDTPSYGYTVEYLGKAEAESPEVRGVCNTTSGAGSYQCERPMFRVTAYGRGRGVAQVVLQANILSQPL